MYSHTSKYRDFLLVPALAPIFYMLSAIIVLRSMKNLSSSDEEPYTW